MHAWLQCKQPRHVPLIITSAVVLSCLAVLLLDWAFSQMYVRLDDTHLITASSAEDIYRDPSGAGFAAIDAQGGAERDGTAGFDEYASYYAESTHSDAMADATTPQPDIGTAAEHTHTADASGAPTMPEVGMATNAGMAMTDEDVDGDHDEL